MIQVYLIIISEKNTLEKFSIKLQMVREKSFN